MHKADFLIIGAGMAGASAGAALARHGSVILLEREDQPGYHTTGRSAAFYAPSYGNEFVRPLTLASGDSLRSPPAGFVDAPLLRHRGALYVAREDQLAQLRQFHAHLQETGAQADWLEAGATLQKATMLQPDYIAGGVYEENCHDIDVAALHQAYLRQLDSGALLCCAGVVNIERVGADWQVETPSGLFGAPVLINAAGAWADDVAMMAGIAPVGLQPLRRTVVMLPGPADYDDDWPLVLDVDDEFYFKPDAGRMLLSPGDETPSAPCDAQPEELDIALAIDRLGKASVIPAPCVEAKWAGLRTFAPDRTPVIGMDSVQEGFFWLAGQGGYGIQTAPAIAQLVVDLLTAGRVSQELADWGVRAEHYAPSRFELLERNRA